MMKVVSQEADQGQAQGHDQGRAVAVDLEVAVEAEVNHVVEVDLKAEAAVGAGQEVHQEVEVRMWLVCLLCDCC